MVRSLGEANAIVVGHGWRPDPAGPAAHSPKVIRRPRYLDGHPLRMRASVSATVGQGRRSGYTIGAQLHLAERSGSRRRIKVASC